MSCRPVWIGSSRGMQKLFPQARRDSTSGPPRLADDTNPAAPLQPELTPEERLRLLARLEALAEERAQLKDEIPELEHALRIAEDQLAAVEQTLAAR